MRDEAREEIEGDYKKRLVTWVIQLTIWLKKFIKKKIKKQRDYIGKMCNPTYNGGNFKLLEQWSGLIDPKNLLSPKIWLTLTFST